MRREIAVGTLREEPKLDANDEPLLEPKRDANGNPIPNEYVPLMRAVGQRIVREELLEKVEMFMRELGELVADAAVKWWHNGQVGPMPGRTALDLAITNTGNHRQILLDKGMRRHAAYCEMAAFCCQACLDEEVH